MTRVLAIVLVLSLPKLLASPVWISWLSDPLAFPVVPTYLALGFLCACYAVMLGHGAIRSAPEGSFRVGLFAGIILVVLQAILIASLVSFLMSLTDNRIDRLLELGRINPLIGFALEVLAVLVLSALAAVLGYLFGPRIGGRGAMAAWSVQVLCFLWLSAMVGFPGSSPMLAAFGIDWVVPFAGGLAILNTIALGALAATALLAGALHRWPPSAMNSP